VAEAARQPHARVRVTARDLAIFEHIGELTFASADALAERHFPRALRKVALNRLALLVRGGYLTCFSRQLLDRPAPVPVYGLTLRGREALATHTLYLERRRNA
jgi:hypothetical protein